MEECHLGLEFLDPKTGSVYGIFGYIFTVKINDMEVNIPYHGGFLRGWLFLLGGSFFPSFFNGIMI